MKIFAFAGSNSSTSINKKLVVFSLRSFPNDQINLIDLNDYEMPIFSVDREKNGFPKEASLFLENISDCDVIICSLSENNRNFSVAFKNVFDWCSRINPKVFQDKKMFLMTTSPGGFGGGNTMNLAKNIFLPLSNIIQTFSLPKFYDNFDEKQGITNEALLAEFNAKILSSK
ncbi:MAG: NAD(P)H-dependent oxidoreductase [Saprospiraceae bacterium]|nr:NAD(P)H-dependent oxidoreductase [Saprospiraceae bacterium]